MTRGMCTALGVVSIVAFLMTGVAAAVYLGLWGVREQNTGALIAIIIFSVVWGWSLGCALTLWLQNRGVW